MIGRPAAWSILIAVAAVSLTGKGIAFSPAREDGFKRSPLSPVERVVLIGILTFCSMALLMALTPPISRDALIHHLAIPKIYISQGRMVDVPFSIFSYYPMNFNMLFMGGMVLASDVAAKLLHFSTYFLTCLAVFGALSKYYGRLYGLLGALLFSSIPVVINVGSWAYVDVALTFFIMSSFLALDAWADLGLSSRGSSERPVGSGSRLISSIAAEGENFAVEWKSQRGFLWITAILTGMSMTTKYNGLIMVFLFFLAVLYFAQYKYKGKVWSFKSAGVFTLLTAVAASPWLVRDIILTGNPIYPLFSGLLGGKEWQPERLQISGLMIRRVLHEQSWLYDVLIPLKVSVTYHWSDFNVDGPLGPVFLLTLPLLIFFKGKPRAVSVAGGMALIYYLFTLTASGIRLRYLIPIYPFLVFLSVHGLHGLSQKRKKTGKYIASAIVGIIVLFNFYLTLPLFSDASPLLFLSGRLDRGAYLRAKIHDYDSYEFMNRKLPENAKVMFLFTGNDGYYLDREYFYDSYYLGYTVKSILKRTSDGGQVAAVLEEMGITHLFINWRFLDRNFQVSLPAGQIELFNKFVGDYLSPLYLSGDEGVYVLKRGGH